MDSHLIRIKQVAIGKQLYARACWLHSRAMETMPIYLQSPKKSAREMAQSEGSIAHYSLAHNYL